MSTPEITCSGCGATVTLQSGNFWRDASGSALCEYGKDGRIHWVSLPPVGAATFTPTSPSALPPVAIKPEATLTPLEQEMLAALKSAQISLRAWNSMGLSGSAKKQVTAAYENSPEMKSITAAIAKAEAVQA